MDIAEHEIGHSLGLDHFTSDDNEQNERWQTTSKAPSTMIPNLHIDSSMQEITELDIAKVREIYGTEGFYQFWEGSEPPPIFEPEILVPQPIPEPIPEPEPPVFPFESVNIAQDKIVVKRHETTMVKVSGYISESEFLRGHPVYLLIIKPDDTSHILKITPTSQRYFETPLTFDKDSILGEYTIQAIYLEHIDRNMDITFEVTNSESSQSSFNLSVPRQSLSGPSNAIEQLTEKKEIPGWLKNNAKWWVEGIISDEEFVRGIEHLAEEKIIELADVVVVESSTKEIPSWVKDTTKWWFQGLISNDDFVQAIQYLVNNGIIRIED